MIETKVTITDPVGLHARPAAQFVQIAARYKSAVKIYGNNKSANAKSMLAVMGLGLGSGAEITITADGEDENECLAALKAFVESNFAEG